MSTPSGIARCHFLAEGVEFLFGSREESLAMSAYHRNRDITLMSPMMAGAEGEGKDKLFSAWKGTVFPEVKISDIQKLKKYRDQFKQYEALDLRIIK